MGAGEERRDNMSVETSVRPKEREPRLSRKPNKSGPTQITNRARSAHRIAKRFDGHKAPRRRVGIVERHELHLAKLSGAQHLDKGQAVPLNLPAAVHGQRLWKTS